LSKKQIGHISASGTKHSSLHDRACACGVLKQTAIQFLINDIFLFCADSFVLWLQFDVVPQLGLEWIAKDHQSTKNLYIYIYIERERERERERELRELTSSYVFI
jgi:hypothetical protein